MAPRFSGCFGHPLVLVGEEGHYCTKGQAQWARSPQDLYSCCGYTCLVLIHEPTGTGLLLLPTHLLPA